MKTTESREPGLPGMHDSRKTLLEWVTKPEASGNLQTLKVRICRDQHRYTESYRFTYQVPLREGTSRSTGAN